MVLLTLQDVRNLCRAAAPVVEAMKSREVASADVILLDPRSRRVELRRNDPDGFALVALLFNLRDGSSSEPILAATRQGDAGVTLALDCSCEASNRARCEHGAALLRLLVRWGVSEGYSLPVRGVRGGPPEQLAAALNRLVSKEPAVATPPLSSASPPASVRPGASTASPAPAQGNSAFATSLGWLEEVFAPEQHKRVAAWRVGLSSVVSSSSFSWRAQELVMTLAASPRPLEELRNLPTTLRNQLNLRMEGAAELAAWVASPRATQCQAELESAQARERLRGWLTQSNAVQAVDTLVLNLAVRWHMPAPGSVAPMMAQVFTTRQNQTRARAPTALAGYVRDHHNRKRVLPEQDLATLEYLCEEQSSDPSDDTFTVMNVRRWMEACAPGVVRWADDDTDLPVVLDARRVELGLARQGDRAVWLLHGPDGARPAVGARVARETRRGRARLWVRLGQALHPLETPELPEELLSLALRNGSFALQDLAGLPLESTLFARSLRHPPPPGYQRLAQPVSVSVEAVLRWEDPSLTVQAVARGATGTTFLLDAMGRWRLQPNVPVPDAAEQDDAVRDAGDAAEAQPPQDAAEGLSVLPPSRDPEGNTPTSAAPEPAPPQEGTLTLNMPRPEDVEAFDLWWRHAPATLLANGSPDTLTLQLARKKATLLRAWWQQRPPAVAFRGNRAFERLVNIQQTPRFKVKVRRSGVDWLEVSAELKGDVAAISLEEAQRALAASSSALVELSSGQYERADLEAYAQRLTQLMDLGIEPGAPPQELHALQLALSKASLDMQPNDDVKDLHDAMASVLQEFRGIPQARLPAATASALRPYQRTGVDFLVWAARTLGGALLADDMGLGKTLQVLATLRALRTRKDGAVLVVAPASVVRNWQREAARFTPDLVVQPLERGEDRGEILSSGADIYVTNPALLRRDLETLQKQKWFAVVLDEAQVIKNQASETARAIKSLQAQHRFALTGTPVENRLDDLMSIMGFVAPGYLKGLPANTGAAGLRLMRARLRPLMIRRTKLEAAPELPPRVEERLDCTMTPGQRRLYVAELKKTREMLSGMSANVKGTERIMILSALTRLRQLATDPALLGQPEAGSGKMDELMETLQEIVDEGHKVLVFSQFVRVLDHVSERLTRMGIVQRMLTGSTPAGERQKLVDAFEADSNPQVFLISLKAGGSGLNLQSAAHVVIIDPWWNPAVEAQAIDRTHRIGQTRTVLALRLISRDTVEERIMELQERKRALAAGILDDDAYTGSLTRQDLEFLVSPSAGDGDA